MTSLPFQIDAKHKHRGTALKWAVGALACLLGALQGCIMVSHPPTLLAPASARPAAGDRDDIWAAVTVAATRSELAILDVIYEPDKRTFLLVTVRDEPGTLTFEGPGVGEGTTVYGPMYDGPAETGGVIAMSAQIGRYGDPQREAKLMRDVAKRLEQLHGVGVSPVRW